MVNWSLVKVNAPCTNHSKYSEELDDAMSGRVKGGYMSNEDKVGHVLPNVPPTPSLLDSYIGVKMDNGKPKMELVPLDACKAIAELMTWALVKYPDKDNWRKVGDPLNRYMGAILRHLERIQSGEDIDPDSGLPHAYAVGANALFYLSHYINGKNTNS